MFGVVSANANEAVVMVKVADVNDNAPYFYHKVTIVGIPVDASFTYPIIKLQVGTCLSVHSTNT